MLKKNWLTSLLSTPVNTRFGRRARKVRQERRDQPASGLTAVEALEDKTLLAATTLIQTDLERASGSITQAGWNSTAIPKGPGATSFPLTLTADGTTAGITATLGGDSDGWESRYHLGTDSRAQITGTSWNEVVEDFVITRDEDATLSLTGLTVGNQYTFEAWHNDSFSPATNDGFATGGGTVTPSVVGGTTVSSTPGTITPHQGAHTDADFGITTLVFDATSTSATITLDGSNPGGFLPINGITLSSVAGSSPETELTLDGSNNLIITDTDGGTSDDTLTIQADVANSRFIINDPNTVLTVNGIPGAGGSGSNTVTIPFVSVTGTGIVVDTLGGDDSVIVDYSLGDFAPEITTITYSGGTQTSSDDLQVVGNSTTTTAVYTPDATTHGDGEVVVNGTVTIDFEGLEPVDITGMVTATLSPPLGGADDVLTISEGFNLTGGSAGTIPALVVSGTTGGVAIETAAFYSNTTVVIDTTANDGNDTITVAGAANAHLNANLKINTGSGSDSLDIDGDLTVSGNVLLDIGGNVTQQAGDVITAAGLGLMVDGTTTLTEANDVDTFAADNADITQFTDVDSVTIGSVTVDSMTVTGITTSDDDVGLTTTTGDVDIDDDVALGTANLFLDVAGNVTQQTGDTITAAGLALMVDGTTTLTEANDVDTFAADNGGETLFNDVDGLTVGEVASSGGGGSTFTLITGSFTWLTAQADAIAMGGYLATIRSAAENAAAFAEMGSVPAFIGAQRIGSVWQWTEGPDAGTAFWSGVSGGSPIGGEYTNWDATFGLQPSGDGPYAEMVDYGGGWNDVPGSLIRGSYLLETSSGGGIGTTLTGIATSNDDVKLTTGGNLDIDDDIDVGTGDLFLDVGGNVTQQAGDTIAAAGLGLMVDGTTTLTEANDVDTIAADNGGETLFIDIDGMTIGSVTVDSMTVTGITTSDDDVKLTTTTGDLDIDADASLGTGDLFLDVAGNVTQQTGDTIAAAGLGLMVDGTTTLNEANDVDTVAADNGGETQFTDVDGVTIGSVTVDSMTVTGITTSSDDVKLTTTTGDLDIDADVSLATGDLFLVVGGNVTQQAGDTITAAGLGLMVDGTTTLTEANDVNTLAADNGAATQFVDVDDLIVGTVTVGGMTVIGMTTSAGDILVRASTSSPGSLVIADPVAAGGGGNILMAAEGTAAASSMSVQANITASGGTGDISLYAANAIDFDSTVTISAASTGDILVSASTDYNDGTPQNGLVPAAVGDGDVVMDSGSTIQSVDGNIEIRGAGDIYLSIVNADSDAAGAVGDVTVTADFAGLGGTASSVLFAGPASSLDPDAWSFDGSQLAAWRGAIADPTNFGPAGTVPISIPTSSLSTINAGTLAGVDVFMAPYWSQSNSTPFHTDIVNYFLAGGSLFLLQDDSGHDGVGEALGIDTFASSTGTVSNGGAPLFAGPFGPASNVSQAGSTGQLDPADVAATGGTVAATNTNGQVTAAIWNPGDYAPGAGAMVIMADVDMISQFLGGAVYSPVPNDKGVFALNATAFLTLAAGDASIGDGSGAIIDNLAGEAANVTASLATFDAATGIGDADDIDTCVITLDVENSGTTGDINITELAACMDVDVNQLDQSNAAGSGNITLATENGNITLVAAQSGSTIAGRGSLTLDANVTAAANETNPSGDVNVNAGISTAGGDVTINADHDVNAGGGGTIVSGGGSIGISADANGSTNGSNNDGTIMLAAGADITAGTGDVTFSLTDCDGAVDSVIVSAADVVKNGAGALRLNGVNTYTGTTNVNAGTLLINGSIAAGAGTVSVNSGGTLGGTGTINTNVDVNSGGTLDPGDVDTTDCSPLTGILSVSGDVEFQPGSTYRVQLNGLTAGTEYDQLDVTGMVDIDTDTVTLDVDLGFSVPVGGQFVIVKNDSTDDVEPATGPAQFLDDDGTTPLPEGAFLNNGLNITYQADPCPLDPGTNDIVLTQVGRFDFNSPSDVTATDYAPVDPGQTNPPSGAGWLSAAKIGTFDRLGPNALLRDGHFGREFNSGTFVVDVLPGTDAMPLTYQVSVTFGDLSFRHDQQRMTVSSPLDAGTTSFTENIPLGTWSTETFTVDVGDDGQVFLLIENLGGNHNWVINALDVRPVTSVGALSIVRADAQSGATPVDADGVTVDTYNGSGASPNALITVSATNGIVTTDVDATFNGVQVMADALGNFTFDLQRPSGDDTVTITAAEVSGLSLGTFDQTYQVAKVRRFDMNATGSPTETGFVPTRGTDTYLTTTGFGWVGHPFERDRATGSDARRDLHFGADQTFQIEVNAGDAYDVRLYLGDQDFPHRNIEVYVEGALVATVSTEAGDFYVDPILGVSSADDILEIQLVDPLRHDNFALAAVDIAVTGCLPGTAPLTAVGTNWANPFGDYELTQADLTPIAAEAIHRWEAAGWDGAPLQNVTFAITDLTGPTLAMFDGVSDTIFVDTDAAGWGWYIDRTPSDDSEFFRAEGVTGMDLLTTVVHEMGHVLGLPDEDPRDFVDNVMVSTLSTGVRRTPDVPQMDARTPHRPQLLSPARSTWDTTPEIAWTSASYAVRYELQVVSLSTGETVIRKRLDTTSFTPGDALAEDTYRVWVRAANFGNEWSDWSPKYDFTVDDHVELLADGTLQVTGTDGPDTITVHEGDGVVEVSLNGTISQHATTDMTSLLVLGLAGDDVIERTGGATLATTLMGQDGNDVLIGGDGRDLLLGQAGNDTLRGGGHNDSLRGGAGDDLLIGGTGNDRVWGDGGQDKLRGNGGHDQLDGGAGEDHLGGGGGNDILTAGQGGDILFGGTGRDILLGQEGGDSVFGGNGRDIIVGGRGRDDVSGGAGDDLLIAGMTSLTADELRDVRREWASSNDYLTRVTNLREADDANRHNGNTVLTPEHAVANDTQTDQVLGGEGLDWFFTNLDNDVLDDQTLFEELDQL